MKLILVDVRIQPFLRSFIKPDVALTARPWTTTHGHFVQMGGLKVSMTAEEHHRLEKRMAMKDPAASGDSVHAEDCIVTKDGVGKDRNDLTTTGDGVDGLVEAITTIHAVSSVAERKPASRFYCTKQTRPGGAEYFESVVTYEGLKVLFDMDLIEFPTTMEYEINDKSKGDALSKGIAFLQLTWFIIQIITRAIQGLTITELELTTAALAGLNSAMYLFWWSKPLDVRCPILIQTKGAKTCLVGSVGSARTSDGPEFSLRRYIRESTIKSLEMKAKRTHDFIHSLPNRLKELASALKSGFLGAPKRVAELFKVLRRCLRSNEEEPEGKRSVSETQIFLYPG